MKAHNPCYHIEPGARPVAIAREGAMARAVRRWLRWRRGVKLRRIARRAAP